MAADEIAVDRAALRIEAGNIEGVGSAIGTARDAIGSMNLGGGAFGLMCSFLVPFAEAATTAADNALRETAELIGREADALRNTADDFDATEDEIVRDLRVIGESVEAVG